VYEVLGKITIKFVILSYLFVAKSEIVIERTYMWTDSYRSVLNGFDTTLSSWKARSRIVFVQQV